MSMNDKIIFDSYYCINSAITEPHHVFICVKVFILMLVPGGLQLLIISMFFCMAPGKEHK